MTAHSFAGRAPSSGSPSHGQLARWAVGLAVGVVAVLAVSYAVFGVAYAIGGSDAVEDTWVGYLGGISLVGGLAASLAAFALAVAARIRHERWALLWLPLSVFPALFVLVAVAEAVWME